LETHAFPTDRVVLLDQKLVKVAKLTQKVGMQGITRLRLRKCIAGISVMVPIPDKDVNHVEHSA
jgi:hypothetical protein